MATSAAAGKYLRISPRKIRIVGSLIRGERVDKAMLILNQTPRRGSSFLKKILKSAYSAAAQKDPNVAEEDLKISTLLVDGGPTLSRWRPRAHGRATLIQKRTSHVRIELNKV